MTNLKKTLAVVLAFAMILSMGAISTFAAYSDVEDGTAVSEAVTVLSNLNILTGFEDGTFRPDETVTRAQMAAIICRMLGYEDQAQSSMGTTVFNDVAADHWASGYVNVTQAQGIINGYGDGNFGPEDKVTYEQAVKMIVSSLGYDLAAARKGGYPTGYLAIASSEGITKKANGRVGDAAARSAIAILVFNALDVQLMDQYVWATDGSDEFGKQAETVLTKHHGIYKYRGVVENTPVSYVAQKASYNPDTTPMATIAKAERLYYSSNDLPRWQYLGYDEEDEYYDSYTAVATKVDVNPYLGNSVIIYAGEDQETGKDTIFSITNDASKNSSFKISATQLVETDGKFWDDEDTIGYTEVGARKANDIALAGNVKVYKNYELLDEGDVNTTAELAELFEEGYGGTVEFISNDADSEYEVMVVIAYDDEAVIETVETEDDVYVYELYTGENPAEIDPEDDDELVIVYKDGELASAADLAESDTVNHIEVTDNFDIYYASSATVEGEVEGYYDDDHIVTINGEDYELSMTHEYYDEVHKLNGEEGIFFLNVDGQIAHSETDPTALGNYAIALATYKAAGGLNKGAYLQVVLADGTLGEYKIGDKAKIYDADRQILVENTTDTPDEVYDYYVDMMTQDDEATDEVYRATVSDLWNNDNLMAKLTISSNKITKIRLLEGGTNTEDDITKKYDAEAMSIGNIDVDDKTIVYSVKQTEGAEFIEADDIVIGSVDAFFSDEEAINGEVKVFDEDEKTSIYGAMVGFGIVKSIKSKSNLFVVTGKRTKDIDDVAAYVLTGVMGGKQTTVTVYDEAEEYTTDPDFVAIGDVLLVSEIDSEGFAKDIQMMIDYDYDKEEKEFTFDDSTAASITAIEDDEIFSGFGTVTASESNKFAIDGDIMMEVEGAYVDHEDNIDAETPLSYRSSATYTLVDFVDDKAHPEVSSKKGAKSLFNIDKYESYAYVRYVDGKMAEVIVFRMSELDD